MSEKIKVEIEMSKDVYNIINDFMYEMEYDRKGINFNDFVVNAAIEKFNRINRIFAGKIDKDGWVKE